MANLERGHTRYRRRRRALIASMVAIEGEAAPTGTQVCCEGLKVYHGKFSSLTEFV